MSNSIPLVRASAVAPLELWLTRNGYPSADLLEEAGLPASPMAVPDRVVAFHCFTSLLAQLAEAEGPELGARIATPEALLLLGAPARAVRASRTVRQALLRIERTFHLHASHVYFRTSDVAGGIEVLEAIPMAETVEIHHQAQQHVATLICSLGLITLGRPLPATIHLAPHPRFGVAHLLPYLGPDIVGCPGRQLRMFIPDAALDLELPWEPELLNARDGEPLDSIARPSLSQSARVLLAGMVEDGNASMDRLALCAGRSRRTLQRFLAAEGTSFIELLDAVRHDHALAQLRQSGDSVSSIAHGVGFRSVSSLSRAVRRWTNTCPRQFRSQRRTG